MTRAGGTGTSVNSRRTRAASVEVRPQSQDLAARRHPRPPPHRDGEGAGGGVIPRTRYRPGVKTPGLKRGGAPRWRDVALWDDQETPVSPGRGRLYERLFGRSSRFVSPCWEPPAYGPCSTCVT